MMPAASEWLKWTRAHGAEHCEGELMSVSDSRQAVGTRVTPSATAAPSPGGACLLIGTLSAGRR